MNVASWEAEHVRRRGDWTALIVGERAWTSAELFSCSSRLAHALIDHGVTAGDRVVIALPNSVELFVACSAVWMAGGVVVVVAPDSEPSLARWVRYCRPVVLVGTPRLASAESIRTSVPTRIAVTGGMQSGADIHCFQALVRDHPELDRIVPRDGDDVAQLCLTSGATGEPRAVVYTHAGTVAFWRMLATLTTPSSPERIALLALPPTAFGARLIGVRFAADVRYVVLPSFAPESVAAAIEKHGVTEMSLLPTMAAQLVTYNYSRDFDCSCLRTVNLSGAHVSKSLVEKLKSRIGGCLAGRAGEARKRSYSSERSVLVHYGLTETGGGIASTAFGGDGLVGRAVPGVTIRIVDDAGRDLPPGQVGEIIARSPYNGTGYWEDPVGSAAVFRDGYVHTGDLGCLDESGELWIEGRKKEIIIQGGYNISPGALIAAIGRLAGVSQVVVVGVPNDLLGEEAVACVVRAGGAGITEADVLAQCRAELDPRQVPVRVRFFEEFPRTHNGKVDTLALKDRVELGRETPAQPSLLETLALERPGRRSALLRDVVRSAVGEVLRETGSAPKRSEELASDALFGELGLDSLGAVRLIHLLRERLGRPLSPIAIYSSPSIAALSASIEEQWFQGGGPGDPADAAPRAVEDPDAVAIVGIGCRLPGGVTGPEEFWTLLERGIDAVREPPAARQFPDRETKAAFLDRADEFDASFFQLRAQAASIDPRHRMLLEVAWEALEDAGQDALDVSRLSVGLFLGIFGHRYGRLDALESAPGMGVAYLCQFLDIRGPVLSIDTTCSSSLVAVHNAVCSLKNGECRVALAGGVNLIAAARHDRTLGVTSADGRTKAFGAAADGFGQGEGCVLLVLKRLADAERAGDRIYATIRGTAINHDGRSTSLTAPSAAAQADVIRSALRVAGVASDMVQYVEAHGSGTVLGDPIEVEGLARVFGTRATQPLEIGSVKTYIGHLEAAAGAAALARVALSITHRRLTKSLHFSTPNPHVEWQSVPIRVRARTGAWPDPEAPLIAGVSAFGMSGTNAHAVACEGPPEPADRWSIADALASAAGPWLLPLSARSPKALRAAAEKWAAALENGYRDATCRDIAYTASCRRAHLEYRVAVVGRTQAEWASRLRGYAAGSADACSGHVSEPSDRLVMVFGDASPYWPRTLLQSEPLLRDTVAEWAEAAERLGVGRLLDDAAESEPMSPDAMAAAQLRSVVIQVGLHRVWTAWGAVPHAVVGSGAGEIGAAHVAGMITREQAVRLAVARGRILGGRRADVAAGDLTAVFSDALGSGLAEPVLEVFSTFTAGHAPVMDGHYWARQVRSPIHVRRTLEVLLHDGVSFFLHTGVDPALIRELHSAVTASASSGVAKVVSSLPSAAPERDAIVHALGQLHCAGYRVDWTRRYAVPGRFVRLPTYQWEHRSYWDDTPAAVEREAESRLGATDRGSSSKRFSISHDRASNAARKRDAGSVRRYLIERLAEFGEPFGADALNGARTLAALGVDSLGITQLRAELARDLGIRLAADAIAVDSTVDDVLSCVDAALPSRAARSSGAGGTVSWLRSDGNEPTHYWIHPIGGGIACYRDLARLSSFRSGAIEMPALCDPRQVTPSSIEEMAQHYIELLRAVGLPRQFVLGGWSLGGLIAYEMAKRLNAEGRAPALVVLIDSYLWSAEVGDSNGSLGRLEAAITARMESGSARRTKKQALAPSANILRGNLHAWRRYRAPSYEGPVLSARATVCKGRPDRYWERVACALEVETIEGDHDSIMCPPAVERVVAAVNARLDALVTLNAGGFGPC